MADELPVHKNIFEAKLGIMRDVQYVQKTGTLEGDGGGGRGPRYKFASERDLISNVRPAMLDHGVTISCAGIVTTSETFVNPGYEGKAGKATSRRILTCRFVFHHVASNTSEEQWVVGEGTDNGDKASAKAMTIAIKYALRQWLLLETGDDPDKKASPQDREEKEPEGASLQKRIAAGVKQIMESTTLKELDVHAKRIAKSSDEVKGPLMNALAKRRDEIIRTTEAGSNG